MKVFIVVAVIIVTICLACLMKAKAEGDRIYDELAYKHFSSKETGTVFIVENNQDYQNCIERIEDERIIEDEIVIVDSYSDGVELEGIIEKLTTTKRIIRVRVPQNHNLTKKELFKIGLNNSFAKKINMDKGK